MISAITWTIVGLLMAVGFIIVVVEIARKDDYPF